METQTILLVEDEAIIALSESSAIENFGYKVVVAYNGEEAIKIALNNASVQLILMDIDLGKGIDGTEAAKQILSERNLPIVFLTSHSERPMVDKVRGITRYGYIIKNSGNFVLQSSIEMAFELHESISKTKEKEEELLREQALLRALLENIPDYIYFKDRESRFIRASTALAKSFGLSKASLLEGKTDFDFFSEEHAAEAYGDEQSIINTGQPLRKEERETRSGCADAWVSTAKLPLRDSEGHIIGTFGVSRDITELKLAEMHLREQTRLYSTLSNINRAIIRVKDRSELFDNICRIVVTEGAFRVAWIGMLVEESGKIVQVAQAVQDVRLLVDRSDLINKIPMERNPIGLAISSGKVTLYDNPEDINRGGNDECYFRSAAAIPFGVSGRALGTLNIYATEIGFFSMEERHLLEEIGLDMSFALEKMDLGNKVSP